MLRCEKCNIDLDIIDNKCPLCNSVIEEDSKHVSSYPIIKPIVSNKLLKKLLFFLTGIISVLVVILNIALTPGIKWSLFVILQLMISSFIFSKVLSGRLKIIKILLSLNLFVSVLSVFWDWYTGFHGWSVNYVVPSLCIGYGAFMIVLRLVRYYVFRENSSFIYLNICLEFLPLILVLVGYANLNILVYWSVLLGVMNLLLLLVFDGSNFKDDILKKLHI